MILANVAAAEELEARQQACMYRVHDPPDPEKLAALRDFLDELGIPGLALAKGQVVRPELFNRVLARAAGHARGRADQRTGAARPGPGRLQPEQYRPFRSGLAALRPFHLADPALCRSARPSRADRRTTPARDGGAASGRDRRAHLGDRAARRGGGARRARPLSRDACSAARSARSSPRGSPGSPAFGLFVTLAETGADGLVPMSQPARRLLRPRRRAPPAGRPPLGSRFRARRRGDGHAGRSRRDRRPAGFPDRGRDSLRGRRPRHCGRAGACTAAAADRHTVPRLIPGVLIAAARRSTLRGDQAAPSGRGSMPGVPRTAQPGSSQDLKGRAEGLSIRALLCLRPAAVCRVGGPHADRSPRCVDKRRLPADADGQLFARGLDEIDRSLHRAGVEPPACPVRGGAAVAARQRARRRRRRPEPRRDSTLELWRPRHRRLCGTSRRSTAAQWGELIARLIAAAKQASPRLAALSQDTIDKAVFDGMTAALDRFSRYSPPEVARDQRAARDGFGGIGVTLDSTGDDVPRHRGHAARPGRTRRHPPRGPDRRDRRGRRLRAVRTRRSSTSCADRSAARSPVSVLRPGTAQPGDLRLQPGLGHRPDRDRLARRRHRRVPYRQLQPAARPSALPRAWRNAEQQTGGHLAGIVLDLRGNPGGLLDQAVSLADLFIADGPDRIDRRSPSGKPPVFRRLGRRHRPADAARRADQRRLRLGFGDRGRGAAGCRTRRRRSAARPTARAPCKPCCVCPTMAS